MPRKRTKEEKEPGRATGPRTKAGKRRASQNARTHGLRAVKLILEDERQEDYDRLRRGWHLEYQPENYRAQRLVDRVVLNDWLLARAERRLLLAESGTATESGCDPLDWSDEQHDRVQLMHRYKSTLERAFQRVYRDLETLRKDYERARQAVRERAAQEGDGPELDVVVGPK